MIGSFTVITEIVPRAYTNFKDATVGGREQSLPIRCKVSLPHRQVDKVGQDSILIDPHVSLSLATSLSGDSQIGCDECTKFGVIVVDTAIVAYLIIDVRRNHEGSEGT